MTSLTLTELYGGSASLLFLCKPEPSKGSFSIFQLSFWSLGNLRQKLKESSRHYQLNQPCHAAGVLRSAGYGSRLATALLVAQLKTENMEAFIVRFFCGTTTLTKQYKYGLDW